MRISCLQYTAEADYQLTEARVYPLLERAVADGRFVVHQSGGHVPFQYPDGQGFSSRTRHDHVVIDQEFESPPSDPKNG